MLPITIGAFPADTALGSVSGRCSVVNIERLIQRFQL